MLLLRHLPRRMGWMGVPLDATDRRPLPLHATDRRLWQMAEGLQKMLRTYARIMSRRRHRMRLLLLLQVVGLKCRPGWRLTAYP